MTMFGGPPGQINLPAPDGSQQGGLAPMPGPAPSGGSGGGDASMKSDLKQAAQILHRALGVADDPEDAAAISKLLSSIHAIQASEQKELHSAMGLSSQQKLIMKSRRANGLPTGQ